jgi:tetratricopeptide (TPR) repeat protein
MDHDSAEAAKPRRWRAAAFLLGSLVLLAAGAGFWMAFAWHHAAKRGDEPRRANRPEDPRLAYTGPFRNIHPDVAYVGDAKCTGCHSDKADSYRRHPMGRSLLPISQATRPRCDAGTHNPFEALGTLFLIQDQGGRLVQRQIGRDAEGQVVYQQDTAIDYVLGSGTRGHSYLREQDGYVFQLPISWFAQKQIWDKSPGFGTELRPGRPVLGTCLFCHANRVRPRDNYANRYEQPVFEGCTIGCERCHGPAAVHVQDPGRKVNGVDYTIVNPAHLPDPALRAAVCEQCHLGGSGRVLRRGRGLYDFRPGLLLEPFWSVFVPAASPDGHREAIGHVEQMYLSKCYLRSQEKPEEGLRKLGCTSCHDPHQRVAAEERVAHYRRRCLQCHPKQGECRKPEETRRLTSKEDSCIDCHMPRYTTSDIAHTASVDHRIPRLPGSAKADPERSKRREFQFVPLHPEHYAADDKDLERDLGLALVQIFAQGKVTPNRCRQDVLGLLDAAVDNDPDDLEAAEGRAMALSFLRGSADALEAYEAILAKAPEREVSLARAALLAQLQKRFEPALDYWRRAVARNPHEASYRANLTRLLIHQKHWQEARSHCQCWLDLDPSDNEARALWVSCLLHAGEKAAAQTEFDKIKRLRPSNLPLLEARFAVESRSP